MAPAGNLLVVIGVTGIQGGSVARYFQTHEKQVWRVRGVTRDPTSQSARAAKASLPDLELVAGNLDAPETLDAAFAGADAIFLATDFWQFLRPGSSTFTEAAAKSVTPNRLAMEKEMQHGKNAIDAAARAHEKKPLHRLVFSTLSDSMKWSNGTITNNLHFDGKAECTAYLRNRKPALAKVSSFVQIGFYLENYKNFPAWAPYKEELENGTTVVFPRNGMSNTSQQAKPIPYLHPPNDTGPLVHALVMSPSAPAGTVLLGVAGRQSLLTAEQFAELFGRVHNVKTRVKLITAEDIMATTDTPEWLAKEINDSSVYVSTYGWDGGEPGVKLPEEIGVQIEHLTDLEEYVKTADWPGLI